MSRSLPRIIAIMGSGETAPTMIKTHRDLLARLDESSRAVILDTPYGFQENASELAARAVEYFRQSVGRSVEVAGLTRLKHDGDRDERMAIPVEQGLNRVRDSDFVFAGPGSPTYALNQWSGTPLREILLSKMRSGGIVTFSSAAALTLGRFTVPVYEIYKVGQEPHWLDGLDVLSDIGLDVAIIPHFDNAEGGHHDTRYCYLGQRRLQIMEEMLPEGTHVIGIDEHTGLIIDLDAQQAVVVGNGNVTIRTKRSVSIHPSGTTLGMSELRGESANANPVESVGSAPVKSVAPATAVGSLADEEHVARTAFDAALRAGDSESAVATIIALEDAIHRWSADTLQSDEVDRARATLRSMVVRLGDAALSGLADPRTAISPFVEVLLALRGRVRSDKLYELSDLIRDHLVELGVEVRDTPQGVDWELRSSQ